MGARKRNIDVDPVKHRTGISVPVTYDRTDLRFRATFAGVSYEEREQATLNGKVHKAIEDSLNMEWTPIIKIKEVKPFVSSRDEDEYFIGFKIERFWLARFPDGTYKSCQWDGKEKGYLLLWCQSFSWEKGEFVPPTKDYYYFYLPYTDEIWDQLAVIQEVIRTAKIRFKAFFETPEGLGRLLSSHLLALPEPGR